MSQADGATWMAQQPPAAPPLLPAPVTSSQVSAPAHTLLRRLAQSCCGSCPVGLAPLTALFLSQPHSAPVCDSCVPCSGQCVPQGPRHLLNLCLKAPHRGLRPFLSPRSPPPPPGVSCREAFLTTTCTMAAQPLPRHAHMHTHPSPGMPTHMHTHTCIHTPPQTYTQPLPRHTHMHIHTCTHTPP